MAKDSPTVALVENIYKRESLLVRLRELGSFYGEEDGPCC
jgi:hypothetical protein